MRRELRGLFPIVLCLAAVLALAIAGCTAPSSTGRRTGKPAKQTKTVYQEALTNSMETLGEVPKASKAYKVGYLLITLQNPFWVTLKDGAVSAGKDYGLTVEPAAAPSENDVVAQLNTLETMVSKGYDAIVVHTITDKNLVSGIAAAQKKGILVVDADGRVDRAAVKQASGKDLPFLSMLSFEKQGELGAQAITKKLGDGGGKVAIIEGIAGAPQSDARAKGARAAFEKAGFTVVASQPGNWDSKTALDVATNILQANPDLKAIYCANDVMALAAAQAVAQAGKKGEVLIVGTDFIPDARKAIEDGRMLATVAFSPYMWGRIAVAATLKMLEGGTPPSNLQLTNVVIDKSNLDRMTDWK